MDIILPFFNEPFLKVESIIIINKNSISSIVTKKCYKRGSAAENGEKNANDEKKVNHSMRFQV